MVRNLSSIALSSTSSAIVSSDRSTSTDWTGSFVLSVFVSALGALGFLTTFALALALGFDNSIGSGVDFNCGVGTSTCSSVICNCGFD